MASVCNFDSSKNPEKKVDPKYRTCVAFAHPGSVESLICPPLVTLHAGEDPLFEGFRVPRRFPSERVLRLKDLVLLAVLKQRSFLASCGSCGPALATLSMQ